MAHVSTAAIDLYSRSLFEYSVRLSDQYIEPSDVSSYHVWMLHVWTNHVT